MSQHDDLGPELRRLAQLILERLDPAVRAAAAMAGESMAGESTRDPGRCQQAWCPVCALAAWVSGEQHPMLGVIAEHGVTLMSVIQAMVATPADSGTAGPAESVDDRGDGAPPPSSNVRFHHIPIVVEDGRESDMDTDADRDVDV